MITHDEMQDERACREAIGFILVDQYYDLFLFKSICTHMHNSCLCGLELALTQVTNTSQSHLTSHHWLPHWQCTTGRGIYTHTTHVNLYVYNMHTMHDIRLHNTKLHNIINTIMVNIPQPAKRPSFRVVSSSNHFILHSIIPHFCFRFGWTFNIGISSKNNWWSHMTKCKKNGEEGNWVHFSKPVLWLFLVQGLCLNWP